jgi:hypothetical protein
MFALLAAACGSSPSAGSRLAVADADHDGFDLPADCDDRNAGAHPGAREVPYDGVDQDCDGADLVDADRDGHAAVELGGDDCDDRHPGVAPGRPELCGDGVDQDCDGADLPCPADTDGDGFDAPEDCDDGSAAVHPGADEIPYDGVDQDCADGDLTDVDRDGHAAVAAGGDDCDDARPGIAPGQPEVCGDGVDQDCDGADTRCATDRDVDGVLDPEDCDPDDPTVHPGAAELPNDGVDQDCDGVDLLDADGDGHWALEVGGDDCDDLLAARHPGQEDPCGDGLDADCSGRDPACPGPGEDLDGDGHGSWFAGGDDCDDGDAGVHPGAAEVPLDELDQDCDGRDWFAAGALLPFDWWAMAGSDGGYLTVRGVRPPDGPYRDEATRRDLHARPQAPPFSVGGEVSWHPTAPTTSWGGDRPDRRVCSCSSFPATDRLPNRP